MPRTPRYREIADDLRTRVATRGYLLGYHLAPGKRLPTEAELSDYYQVARQTTRNALTELAAEALIESRGRNGTFIRDIRVLYHSAHREHPDRQDAPGQATADSWFSEVREAGMTPSQDFEFSIIAASPTVATNLRVDIGDLVIVRECTRYADEVPRSLQTSYYPRDVGEKCGLDEPRDIKEGTVRRMAARGFREVGHADAFSARPANVDEATLFRLPTGASVLVHDRVAFTTERPVRYTHEVHAADRSIVTYESGDCSAMRTAAGEVAHAAPAGNA
jgi:GntR family transcriptional regulator